MGMMGIFDPACCKQAEECLARGLVVEAARILLPHKSQGHRRGRPDTCCCRGNRRGPPTEPNHKPTSAWN